MKFQFTGQLESDTQRLGQAIGVSLQQGCVVGLTGTLGSGKTRLTQAIGSALEIPAGEVVSPTYTIAMPHDGTLPLLHLDAYRINEPSELDELGLDEAVESGVVLIVEWASRIEAWLPPLDFQIAIEHHADESRTFTIESRSPLGLDIVAAVECRLAN